MTRLALFAYFFVCPEGELEYRRILQLNDLSTQDQNIRSHTSRDFSQFCSVASLLKMPGSPRS